MKEMIQLTSYAWKNSPKESNLWVEEANLCAFLFVELFNEWLQTM